jgi:hypothetical protein
VQASRSRSTGGQLAFAAAMPRHPVEVEIGWSLAAVTG